MSLSAYSFFIPAIGECIDPLLLNASELVVFLLFLSYASMGSLFLLPAVCLSRTSSFPYRELSRAFDPKSYSGKFSVRRFSGDSTRGFTDMLFTIS